ncbi:mechanosensitive ion channel [Porphyromonadaceae bacterium W3.11]|nr:mechanosensitive ion channel [Porphyromonadaceae bacterium W3.11]
MDDFLDTIILNVLGYQLNVRTLIYLIIFCLATYGVLRLVKYMIYKSNKLSTGEKFSVNKLSRYVIAVIAFLSILKILGIDITVLLAGSAALLVGIGFGLQNVFSDFISGLILLFEGALRVDDVIEVNGLIYKLEEIRFRTTTVLGRNENHVILPNSQLTNNSVINWSYRGKPSRFKIDVGVDYDTDVDELMTLLTDVTKAEPRVLKNPEPFVRFEDYEDSALKFGVYFYTYEIFKAEQIKSQLRIEIFKELKKHDINIPFPQRVIRYHNDEIEH